MNPVDPSDGLAGSDLAVSLRNVRFQWPRQPAATLAIEQFELARGASVFVSGPSGSGKSTLLALLGGVITAQAGDVTVLGSDPGKLSAAARDRFRVDHIGFIFQQFNLIPYLSILDNVLLPCRFSTYRRGRAMAGGRSQTDAAQDLLRALDLASDLWSRPAAQLSIGQQQRVAAARALIGAPGLLIADEPTSALDADRQQAFLDLILAQTRQSGASLVFVSHDQRLAQRFDTRIALDDINRASVEVPA